MIGSRAQAVVWGLLVVASATPLHAQREARPEAFYRLSCADPPDIEPDRLPAPARSAYQGMIHARERLQRRRARTWTSDPLRLQRLERRRTEARDALYRALRGHRGRLSPEGWLLYGVTAARRTADSYVSAMDAYAAALRSWEEEDIGPEPTLDQQQAVRAFRRAAARAGEREVAVWARYFEAYAWIQMQRIDAADAALRTVAAAASPHRLVVEASFRLGEHAFERGEWGVAARWYERALVRSPEKLRALTLYKLAWAHWLQGQDEQASRRIDQLADGVPEPIARDVQRLEALLEVD